MAPKVSYPLMVRVESNTPQFLASLRDLRSEAFDCADVQARPHIDDAKFDPHAIASMAYQTIGVIGTLIFAAKTLAQTVR